MSSLGRPPAYPGEDTRPTSRKELLGFYTYSFAAEVFVVCGLGAFIPITLESLARASPSAVLADDHSRHCLSGPSDDGTSPAAHLLLARTAAAADEGVQCVFHFLGAEINTASFAMYTFSVSVALQALVVVTMSGAADHGRYRKALLLTFALLGSTATVLFLAITPDVFALGSILAIIGNVSVGASSVLLNSFLPLLVRNHPKALEAQASAYARVPTAEEDEDEVDDDAATEPTGTTSVDRPRTADTSAARRPSFDAPPQSSGLDDEDSPETGLLPSVEHILPAVESVAPYPPSPAAPSPSLQLSTKISSYGVGIGYAAAVVVQILALVILSTTGSTLFSLRLVLTTVGLWWFTFTIPVAFWLRPRPGPPLSLHSTSTNSASFLTYLSHSWLTLYRTLLAARRLRDVLLFLAAWFLLSDAIATVSGVAILFAKTTLGMSPRELALINCITTLSGILGALTWSPLSRWLGLKPTHTILCCIALFELIPLYGLAGYLPFVRDAGVGGLQRPWEMYPLAVVYGVVLGGLSSYCRSLFGALVPRGHEAAFFALFAITDKGSSVFGPAVVGVIVDTAGDIRPAFFFLAALIGLPLPLLALVDVERGRRAAERVGAVEEEEMEEEAGRKGVLGEEAEGERYEDFGSGGRSAEEGSGRAVQLSSPTR